MGQQSKIQWTDATWNPWHGCVKVSPGCKYCYMFRDKERYKKDPTEVIRSAANFNAPLRWGKIPANDDMKIFTCSWSDFFIEAADTWREDAWKIIKDTPQLTYQILTKRPERIKDCLPADWGEGYPNVWLGVSVESQLQTDRILFLSDIPAQIRFISAEPLIGPIDFIGISEVIHWMIIGGESGNENGKYKYRPCNEGWIYEIIGDCNMVDIPVFVKQLGTHLSKELKLKDRHGGNMDEWPESLQIREFPELIINGQ